MRPSYLVNKDGLMSLRLVDCGTGTGEVWGTRCECAGQSRTSAAHVMSYGLRGAAARPTQRVGVIVHCAGSGVIG